MENNLILTIGTFENDKYAEKSFSCNYVHKSTHGSYGGFRFEDGMTWYFYFTLEGEHTVSVSFNITHEDFTELKEMSTYEEHL